MCTGQLLDIVDDICLVKHGVYLLGLWLIDLTQNNLSTFFIFQQSRSCSLLEEWDDEEVVFWNLDWAEDATSRDCGHERFEYVSGFTNEHGGRNKPFLPPCYEYQVIKVWFIYFLRSEFWRHMAVTKRMFCRSWTKFNCSELIVANLWCRNSYHICILFQKSVHPTNY